MESIVQIEIKRSIDDALGGAYRQPRCAAIGSPMAKSCRDERTLPVA
jgi:hypothetical protein